MFKSLRSILFDRISASSKIRKIFRFRNSKENKNVIFFLLKTQLSKSKPQAESYFRFNHNLRALFNLDTSSNDSSPIFLVIFSDFIETILSTII
jgi:hypothetical protein